MKILGKIVALSFVFAGLSQGAVTIATKNFNSLTDGLPVLDAAGNPLVAGSRSWSVGSFATTFDFSTATVATIQSGFTLFGATSTTFGLNGLFNANSTASLPANDTSFTGKTIYTLIGNGATVATSTAFAILTNNILFPVVDAGGNGAATQTTVATSNVVFGTVRAPASQPNASSNFANGVALATTGVIPEPSAALLGAIGALGLLRRRRN